MLIKAAINGGRTKAEHAAVPVTPEEQAADVVACLKAGAGAIHLHVRVTSGSSEPSCLDSNEHGRQDEHPIGAAPPGTPLVCAPGADVLVPSENASSGSERESLYAEDVARTLLAVRKAAPDAAIGVSTGAWILPGAAARFEAVRAWALQPDFASVNFIEEGAIELAQLLLSNGVAVEAGLSEAKAAEIFLQSGLANRCIRVLLEPQEQEMSRALENVNAMEQVLGVPAANVRLPPLLLHGTETTAWPMLDEAIARGYGVRIGFEDTLVLPDGRIAKDNAELLTEAVQRAVGRM